MKIRARMGMSADGYVTTPSGWPALTADPAFVPGASHGIRDHPLGALLSSAGPPAGLSGSMVPVMCMYRLGCVGPITEQW
jgi:hypothetical protein